MNYSSIVVVLLRLVEAKTSIFLQVESKKKPRNKFNSSCLDYNSLTQAQSACKEPSPYFVCSYLDCAAAAETSFCQLLSSVKQSGVTYV